MQVESLSLHAEKPLSVLVVDDEQYVRESIVKILSAAGYNAQEVGGGREALEN